MKRLSSILKGNNLLVLFILLVVSILLVIYYNLFYKNVVISYKIQECCADCSSTNLFEMEGDIRQDDIKVLSYLRSFHLTPPSTHNYTLVDKTLKNNPSEYEKEIFTLFKGKKNGVFVEAGANDGEFRSNTLKLEMLQNWTGVLIEPNPFMLVKLRLTNRKAWISDNCLSLYDLPQKIRFMHRVGDKKYMDGMGIIEHSQNNPVPPQTSRNPNDYIFAGSSECFPIYSIILAALNTTVIDYLSLDVEGIELRVLKAIPFHLLTIKVMSIEYNLIPEGYSGLLEFLSSKNYEIIRKRHVEVFAVNKDYINEFNLK